MDRRPSIVSVSSLSSLSGLLKPASLHTLPESASLPHLQNGSAVPIPRKLSVNGKMSIDFDVNGEEWDPDELFAKHTVAEVKLIQQRLRSDADAKQEELRLMVGERYRDLLQASTSIIAISDSSKRVVSTLGDMQRTAVSVESVHSPKASLSGQGDSQLHMLQSLAAHMKLLLDAPEHLWRLLERKLYLYAAWLFLVSRVVHRSLSRNSDEDDAPWTASGMEISEQFPLVQRQWDAVSQFRSQIIQKATASLREPATTAVEICATLLTLHLLESRPLPETLATFLSQRNRTLTTVLNENLNVSPNGAAISSQSAPDGVPVRSRKVIVREVRQKLKAVLEVVSRTLGTSRTIFIEKSGKTSSLMGDVLEHIQIDDSRIITDLPPDLRLTTQSLLSSLPSANHFLLLPLNIRTYKPYVDSTSLSSSDISTQLQRRLDDWFQKALHQVRPVLESRFADLRSIREIWQVRKWADHWTGNADGLREQERTQLGDLLDQVCKQRVITVWNAGLNATIAAFKSQLESSLSQLEASEADKWPAQYLFRPLPLPSIQTPNLLAAQTSFQKFKGALQNQIVCRTPLLDSVVSTLEDGIKNLRDDMDVVCDIKGASSSLVVDLSDQFRRDTVLLCNAISQDLTIAVENACNSTEPDLKRVMFIGRIASELSTSSTAFDNLDCEATTLDDLRTKLKQVHRQAMSVRRERDIAKTLEVYLTTMSKSIAIDENIPHPSSALIEGLLSLTESLQTASSLDDTIQRGWTSEVLHEFAVRLLDNLMPSESNLLQCVWDVSFVLQIIDAWAPAMKDTCDALRSKLSQSLKQTEGSSSSRLNSHDPIDMTACLSRLQHLLGMLLPASYSFHVSPQKPSSLLQLGLPSSDSPSLPTLQLVKPSARFGLLLVGSSYVR